MTSSKAIVLSGWQLRIFSRAINRWLSNKRWTDKNYLAHIDSHNSQGPISWLPTSITFEMVVLDRAAQLDAEHAQGKVRGPLTAFRSSWIHVPEGPFSMREVDFQFIFSIQDVLNTHRSLGIPTTVGTFALLSAEASKIPLLIDKVHRIVNLSCGILSWMVLKRLKQLMESGLLGKYELTCLWAILFERYCLATLFISFLVRTRQL